MTIIMTLLIYTSHTLPAHVYSFDLISFHHRLCLQAPWCQIILTDNGKWFHFVALLINVPGSTLSSTSEIPDVSRFKAVCHFWFLFMCRKSNISRVGSPFCFAHRLFNQSNACFFPTEVFNNSSDSGLGPWLMFGRRIAMKRRRRRVDCILQTTDH